VVQPTALEATQSEVFSGAEDEKEQQEVMKGQE
jgi:hypothetical protein